MKRETIEKYLDEIGITPGEWEVYENVTHNYCEITGKYKVADVNKTTDAHLIASSRKMLVESIDSIFIIEAYERSHINHNGIDSGILKHDGYNSKINTIQSATGKPWAEIKTRLEDLS